MPEKEPQYFKEFRKHIDKRFDAVEIKIDKEIDDLAAMTMRQFDRIDQRFSAVDKRFDAMDKRFDAMDERFDGVDARLDKIEGTMSRHDVRLQKVERAAFA